jgi:hypothetical protein
MPSDDFMSEINEAVTAVTSDIPQQNVTTVVTDNNEVKTSNDNAALEERLLNTMESPIEAEQRKTLKLKEKPADDKAAETPTTDVTKETPDDPTKPKLPYLDRFLRQDNAGNLVIGDGVIIAAKGPARTYYENIKKEGREARDEAQRLAISNIELGKQFKALYNEFNTIKDSPAHKSLEVQTGMSAPEINDALQLMKQYKVDPITAIKSLLTQARMRGIDLNSIGINGGIDPATVQSSIEKAIEARFARQNETAQSQTDPQETAEQEVREFLGAYPDAAQYADIIAKAKDRFPEKPLEVIWLEYQAWQRRQLAAQDEQVQQSFTQKQQRNNPNPATRVVTKPKSYEQMTYAEIARDLENNGV